MGEGITLVNGISNAYIPDRTFFISGFAPEVIASQTGLPVNGISIEMDWNS